MKFYNRDDELKELTTLFERSTKGGTMVALTGRRRVGKTALALTFAKKHRLIYFFVAKKSENLLCQEYIAAIKSNFDVPIIGNITSFKQIFELLLQLAQKYHFILIIKVKTY